MLNTPFRSFLKSASKFSWVKSSPESQCLHHLYLQRLLVSPFETLSFLSSFRWNQFLKLLLKLPFCTLVSPLSNCVAFKQILQVWNVPRVSVQLQWKSVGESWCGGNLTIKLLLVAFMLCRRLLPIYKLKAGSLSEPTEMDLPIPSLVSVSARSSACLSFKSVFFKKVTDHVFVSSSSCLSEGSGHVVCNFLPTPLYLTTLGPSSWTLASQDCGPQLFYV